MREGHGLIKYKDGSFFEGLFNNDGTNSYGILVLCNVMTAKGHENAEFSNF